MVGVPTAITVSSSPVRAVPSPSVPRVRPSAAPSNPAAMAAGATPAAPGAPAPRPSRRTRLLVFIVPAVLVLAGGATAAVVLVGSDTPKTAHRITIPATEELLSPEDVAPPAPADVEDQPVTTSTAPVSSAPVITVSAPAPTTAAPVAAAPAAGARPTSSAARPPSGPATVLRQHLEGLADGRYAAAFALMSPTYRSRNPRWPALRAQAAPAIRVTHVGRPAIAGAVAVVDVTFYARDTVRVSGSDTQCRRFSGRAHLQRIGGRWRYDPRPNALTPAILSASNSRCP